MNRPRKYDVLKRSFTSAAVSKKETRLCNMYIMHAPQILHEQINTVMTDVIKTIMVEKKPDKNLFALKTTR